MSVGIDYKNRSNESNSNPLSTWWSEASIAKRAGAIVVGLSMVVTFAVVAPKIVSFDQEQFEKLTAEQENACMYATDVFDSMENAKSVFTRVAAKNTRLENIQSPYDLNSVKSPRVMLYTLTEAAEFDGVSVDEARELQAASRQISLALKCKPNF